MAERRRRGGSTTATRPKTIVGAAKRVRLSGGAAAVKADIGSRDRWQEELWAYYDACPELKQMVLYTGSVASRVRPYAGAIPKGQPDGQPVPVAEPESGIDAALAAAANEELAALRSELGGQSEIMRLINMNLEVAAECFLVGWAPRDAILDPQTGDVIEDATPQVWEIHSISEVQVTGSGQTRIKRDGKGLGVALNPALGDSLIRMWLRHARWTGRADCALRGCMTELRILQSLSNERLALSQANMTRGVFRIPNGIALAGPVPTPTGDSEEDAALVAIQRAVTEPAEDPDSGYVLDYVYLRGERDDLHDNVFGPVDLARKRDVQLNADLDQAVARLARGANLPPEKIMGHMETTFANARQIDRDEFDDYHDPRIRAILDGVTVGYLRPNLMARDENFAQADVDRIVATFDPEDIVGMPPSEESATEGHNLGTVSDEAWRHAKGFSEDDAPDALELLIRSGLKATRLPPEIILAVLEPLAKAAGVELPTPAEALIAPNAPLVTPNGTPPPADPTAATAAMNYQDQLLFTALRVREELRARGIDPKTVGATAARSHVAQRRQATNLGRRLAQIDRATFDRVHTAASASMDRALERAGSRLRSGLNASNRALVASVPVHQIAAHLGPAVVADATGDRDLFEGAFDKFGDDYATWITAAQRRALAASGETFDFGDRPEIEARQADDARESRDWIVAALIAVAAERLYRPEGDARPGEGNPSLTAPASIIRTGLARAGGSPTDAGNGPVGLIATGPTIMGALRDAGATVGGYQWIYGGADRPFEPHEELDGTEFADYSDPALSNSLPFPGFPYFFPGDHEGCTCSVEPNVDGPSAELSTPDGE